MRDALKNFLPDDVLLPSIKASVAKTMEFEFATAKGTAQFAKSAMESPDWCIKTNVCTWWRKKVT